MHSSRDWRDWKDARTWEHVFRKKESIPWVMINHILAQTSWQINTTGSRRSCCFYFMFFYYYEIFSYTFLIFHSSISQALCPYLDIQFLFFPFCFFFCWCLLKTLETWALTCTVLAILCQHVIWLAAAAKMRSRLLHAIVFTSPISDGTCMDSWKCKRQKKKVGGKLVTKCQSLYDAKSERKTMRKLEETNQVHVF